MKHLKPLLFGLVCLLSTSAFAEFVTITRAHEVALSDFRAPVSSHGNVAFKSCSDCELQTVRVTADTRYVLNNRKVTLDEFRRAIATVNARSEETVIVSHHLESDTVTVIDISLRASR